MNDSINDKLIYLQSRRKRTNLKWFKRFSFVFFFFNSFLLPSGLLYTTLLTPVFIVWLKKEKVPIFKLFLIFLLIFSIFFCIHYSNGISILDYIRSSVLYLTCFIFCITLYTFFKNYRNYFEALLEKILKFNFLLLIVALLSFTIWKNGNILWYKNENDIFRLKMFTSESSGYSSAFAPIFFFYFQYYFYSNLNSRRRYLLLSIIISILISLSYGTIADIIITIFLFLIINFVQAKRGFYNFKLFIGVMFLIVLFSFIVIPTLKDSLIWLRVVNIIEGNDTSVNGRSFEAYMLANEIISTKSVLFGIGPGQIKVFGSNIINDFYEYYKSAESIKLAPVRIPSAAAETLAIFGYFGLTLRIAVEVILFFKTRVIKSSYRLTIFLYVFIIQFVGSSIVGLNEYLLWIITFSNIFPDSYFKKSTSTKTPTQAESYKNLKDKNI